MHRSKLAGIIIDCKAKDPKAAAEFWSAALGMATKSAPPEDGDNYVGLVDPEDRLHHIEVQAVDHESRVHLDIAADDVEAEVKRLEELGAKRVAKIRDWVVLEAPTGQRFCVVPGRSENFMKTAKTWE